MQWLRFIEPKGKSTPLCTPSCCLRNFNIAAMARLPFLPHIVVVCAYEGTLVKLFILVLEGIVTTRPYGRPRDGITTCRDTDTVHGSNARTVFEFGSEHPSSFTHISTSVPAQTKNMSICQCVLIAYDVTS